MKWIACITTLLVLTGCKSTSDLNVVENFDLDRYTGVWYEAARLPHRFEENLSSVSAEYSFNNNGTIKVLNRGFNDQTQQWEEIEGIAKFKKSKKLGWLKISFFKPFYASYKIIYLNDDYTQAIVTGPTYGFLWILVRDPALPQSDLDQLVKRVAAFGFDTGSLILVDQSKNKDSTSGD